MQQGQYILDRWMVSMIREICSDRSIDFTSYSDDWLIELAKDEQRHRVIGYKFDLNDSVASTIAGDKVAAYQMLQKSGIPAVEHRLVRTKAGDYADWADGLDQIVVKPLDGTSGHGVVLLDDTSKVHEYITSRPSIAAWAASPYQKIESEQRYIVLDGKIVCSYKKIPVNQDGLAMFNLGLGARPEVVDVDSVIEELAISAAASIGLRLAAVDIITVGGKHQVLEVNDGIMMENFMRHSDRYKQIAYGVYESIIDSMFDYEL